VYLFDLCCGTLLIVPFLPDSPRMRRRMFWIGLPVIVAGVVAAVVVSIPNTTPGSGKPTKDEGPAQLVKNTTVPLTRADRLAIDGLLAKFVPAAVERKDATLAWTLAGPELKAGSSLAEWKKGASPVPAFPVKEKTFTGWPTIDVERGQVTLSLLVHPVKGKESLGDYTFAVQTIRSHGRWLVNRLYTIAINHPVRGNQHEIGPADFGAQGTGGTPPAKNPTLSNSWFLPVLFGLIAALGAPFLIGSFFFVRSRRRRRHQAAAELPALPTRR
jgi:hypothetical protein